MIKAYILHCALRAFIVLIRVVVATMQLQGESTWDILGEDCELIYTPGHTAGSISLLHKDSSAVFTGDHLAWSGRLNRLSIMRCAKMPSLHRE